MRINPIVNNYSVPGYDDSITMIVKRGLTGKEMRQEILSFINKYQDCEMPLAWKVVDFYSNRIYTDGKILPRDSDLNRYGYIDIEPSERKLTISIVPKPLDSKYKTGTLIGDRTLFRKVLTSFSEFVYSRFGSKIVNINWSIFGI